MKRIIFMSLIIASIVFLPVSVVGDDKSYLEEEDIINSNEQVPISNAIAERNAVIEELLISSNLSDADRCSMRLEGEDVIEDYFLRYGMIVKGGLDSHNRPIINDKEVGKIQSIDDDGDYRILGKNIAGEWVENPFYDPIATYDIDKREWIDSGDSRRIDRSVIGPLVNDDSLFTTTELIQKYYVHFLVGFKLDYELYLSQDFFDEYDEANLVFQNRYLNGEFNLDNIEEGYDAFWHVGSGRGTRTGTDMGDYIRIVSIPTENSNGLAYLFHEKNGTVYYLSVPLMSGKTVKESLIPSIGLSISADINSPKTVEEEVNEVAGTFNFLITSLEPLKHYEIYDVKEGTTILGPLTDMMPVDTYNYNQSIAINTLIPGDTAHIDISIRAKDISGNEISTRVLAEIKKLSSFNSPTNGDNFDASASAVLKADQRGNALYDVSLGIPSSESLYANIWAKSYISKEDYEEVSGSISYEVTVKKEYILKWQELENGLYVDKTDTVEKSKTYTINKDYKFHTIKSLDIYGLKEATLNSNTLINSQIKVVTKDLMLPEVTTRQHEQHIRESVTSRVLTKKLPSETIDGGINGRPSIVDESWYNRALSTTGQLEVRNDYVLFDGLDVLNDEWVIEQATSPSQIPVPRLINDDVLYQKDLMIPIRTENGVYETSGMVSYERIHSINSLYPDVIHQDIEDINSVTVHSPVVCYPRLIEETKFVQALDKDLDRASLVIDQETQIEMPNTGNHLPFLGYGNRDYTATTSSKQVKFDFDVYLMNDGVVDAYIKAGQWHTLSKYREEITIKVPHWVDEGPYQSYFRTFANNTPSSYSGLYDYYFNQSRDNYYAVDLIDVEVIGQVYDLSIHSTTDSQFETFFFNDKKELINRLKTGTNNHYGDFVSEYKNFLPLMPGTNTEEGYSESVLAKGHPIFFSFKVSGNMMSKDDFALVKPSFHYVTYDGLNRQEVDVWYEEGGRLQNLLDQPKSYFMSLNNTYTGIDDADLIKTASASANLYGLEASQSLDNYIDNYLYSDSRKAEKIGASNFLALDWQQRAFVGEDQNIPAGVDPEKALTGVSQYYGMYMIPSKSLVVPKGTATNQVLTSRLEPGYIIINFDIETIDGYEGDIDKIHLSYDQLGDMFEIEGYKTSQNGFSLLKGDMMFYDSNQSADRDYFTIGTH